MKRKNEIYIRALLPSEFRLSCCEST